MKAVLAAAVVLAVIPSRPWAAPTCSTSDDIPYPSPEWAAREATNFAKLGEGPARQASDPAFSQRWQEQSTANRIEYQTRALTDRNWSSSENVCASWSMQCTGDPYRYPGADDWYGSIGEVTPVNFYDAQGARLLL